MIAVGQTWRHKKRGSVYAIVSATAHVQCSTSPDFEDRYGDDAWTIYRDMDTGEHYVRLTSEFLDGRFERVIPGKVKA